MRQAFSYMLCSQNSFKTLTLNSNAMSYSACCGFGARLATNLMLAMVSPTLLVLHAFSLVLIFTGVSSVYVSFAIIK